MPRGTQAVTEDRVILVSVEAVRGSEDGSGGGSRTDVTNSHMGRTPKSLSYRILHRLVARQHCCHLHPYHASLCPGSGSTRCCGCRPTVRCCAPPTRWTWGRQQRQEQAAQWCACGMFTWGWPRLVGTVGFSTYLGRKFGPAGCGGCEVDCLCCAFPSFEWPAGAGSAWWVPLCSRVVGRDARPRYWAAGCGGC